MGIFKRYLLYLIKIVVMKLVILEVFLKNAILNL